jgi:hypothetical protein
MAKLSDVQMSQGGQPEAIAIQQEISNIAVQESKSPESEYVIYKLVDTKRKGRVHIDGIDDDIFNPKTGKRERIWLLSGSSSIWSTDLVEQLKDKDWLRNNRRSIIFEGGIVRVPKWDERQLEFIKVCRHLIDNPSRRTGSKFEFFEYNPKKQQEAALAKEMLELDMAFAVKDMEMGKVKKLASFFGIVFYDELGEPKVDEGIRRELMLVAKRDPIHFKKHLESKEVEIAYLVKKAIIDNKIDLGGGNGNAIWAKNGGLIGKIPLSRKPHEYLIELAMTNSEEGRVFLEQLQTF